MNGIPSHYELQFRKLKSCTTHICERSIHRPISIIRKLYPTSLKSKTMEVTVNMEQDLDLDYFSKYEVKVREKTVKGWGPYSPTLLFKIDEGGT